MLGFLATAHRSVTGRLLGRPIPGAYAPTSGVGPVRRLLTWARDNTRWRDFAFAAFAATGATLAIHLSIHNLAKVVADLTPHYGADCPVAIVHRASWPDEVIVRGTLGDIREKARAAGLKSQSMILVGRVLTAEDFANSRLYDPEFSHKFRRAERRAPGAAASATSPATAAAGEPEASS